MRRRTFLGAVGTGLAAGVAGCSGTSLVQTTNSRAPPLVEDRPDGAYVPTHTEGMRMVGAGSAGDLRVALTYAYPHRFWVVEREGDDFVAERIEVTAADAVHLMATPFDPGTGAVVPDTGLSIEITRQGTLVSNEVVYPMLSQQMGFHYGANFPLDGDGTYEVTVSVGGASTRRFGSFEGRFGDPATATVTLEYSERDRNDIPYTLLDEEAGRPGVVAPMEMEMVPVGRAPDPLPGTRLGAGTVDDLRLVATRVDAERFGAGPYLAVSPRTRYSGIVVPHLGVRALLDGDPTDLRPGLDPDLGFHYGAPAPALDGGARVTLDLETPPQVARHEGYETAFLDVGTVDVGSA
jgi:uncharacterized protein involved in high-affinity Fe2+ transport